jgi:hypothetical protein
MNGEECVGTIVCKLAKDKRGRNRGLQSFWHVVLRSSASGYIAMLAVHKDWRKLKIGERRVARKDLTCARVAGSTLVRKVVALMKHYQADLVWLSEQSMMDH